MIFAIASIYLAACVAAYLVQCQRLGAHPLRPGLSGPKEWATAGFAFLRGGFFAVLAAVTWMRRQS